MSDIARGMTRAFMRTALPVVIIFLAISGEAGGADPHLRLTWAELPSTLQAEESRLSLRMARRLKAR